MWNLLFILYIRLNFNLCITNFVEGSRKLFVSLDNHHKLVGDGFNQIRFSKQVDVVPVPLHALIKVLLEM